jgi:phage baseplate assembly protein W
MSKIGRWRFVLLSVRKEVVVALVGYCPRVHLKTVEDYKMAPGFKCQTGDRLS